MPQVKRTKTKTTKAKPARMKSSMILRIKKIEFSTIKNFWHNFFLLKKKGNTRKKVLSGDSYWAREVFAVGSGMIGTVREFGDVKLASEYVRNQKIIEKVIMRFKPKLSVIQPVQFISRNGRFILERVYMGPNVSDFLGRRGRYFNALSKRLKKKGIDLSKQKDYNLVASAVENALRELDDCYIVRSREGINFNPTADVNKVLLDFDPKTKNVLFVIIDHENPASKKVR